MIGGYLSMFIRHHFFIPSIYLKKVFCLRQAGPRVFGEPSTHSLVSLQGMPCDVLGRLALSGSRPAHAERVFHEPSVSTPFFCAGGPCPRPLLLRLSRSGLFLLFWPYYTQFFRGCIVGFCMNYLPLFCRFVA